MDESVRHLYVHVPFCVRRCTYCDFATFACQDGDPLLARYVGSVSLLVERACQLNVLTELATAYVGGGTPSFMGPELLERLVSLGAGAPELTFEANPDSLSDQVLAAARDAGATRVSVGVQSLSDQELRCLGRVHGARAACDALERAVRAGFDVSADLMCATPHQTPASWEASLRGVLACGVGHVSVYPLQVEEGTPLERLCEDGVLPWPDEDDEADRMTEASAILTGAGMPRYEVASYARPGKACRHNQAYWTGKPYLGVGHGAASMLDRVPYERLRAQAHRLPAMPGGAVRARLTISSSPQEVAAARGWGDLSFDVEFLNEREAIAEDLMLGVRMSCGACAELVGRAREAIGDVVDKTIANVVGRGLATLGRDGSLRPTEAGWLLGNELYGALWDLADAQAA